MPHQLYKKVHTHYADVFIEKAISVRIFILGLKNELVNQTKRGLTQK